MPLKCKSAVRYRVKTTSSGKKVRLAFCGNKVIEAKNIRTGKTRTQREFTRERKRRR